MITAGAGATRHCLQIARGTIVASSPFAAIRRVMGAQGVAGDCLGEGEARAALYGANRKPIAARQSPIARNNDILTRGWRLDASCRLSRGRRNSRRRRRPINDSRPSQRISTADAIVACSLGIDISVGRPLFIARRRQSAAASRAVATCTAGGANRGAQTKRRHGSGKKLFAR